MSSTAEVSTSASSTDSEEEAKPEEVERSSDEDFVYGEDDDLDDDYDDCDKVAPRPLRKAATPRKQARLMGSEDEVESVPGSRKLVQTACSSTITEKSLTKAFGKPPLPRTLALSQEDVVDCVSEVNLLSQGSASKVTNPKRSSSSILKSKTPMSSLPLVLPARNSPKLLLVEVADDKLDLSGDTGAVGRLKVDDEVVTVDLKGKLYSGSLVSTHSLLVVSINSDTARVDAVVNTFLPAKICGNIFDSEHIIEGSTSGDVYDIDVDVNARESQSVCNSGDADMMKANSKETKKRPSRKRKVLK